MPRDELCDLSLMDAAAAMRAGGASPVDVVRAALDRTERHGKKLNCYLHVLADSAMSDAKARADELADGRDRGPLHGIPVSLKDNVWTAGIPTTGGSASKLGWVPDEDATLWARMKRAGAVLVAKAHLYEFAYGAVNPTFGHAMNPWKPGYETGGSSNGSASSVAAGLCHASIGSDTGGSIRGPAAYCGLVGIKATYGLVSRHGVIPLSYTLDAAGPLTRTVADAAAVLRTIAGHDPLDPTTSRRAVPDYLASLDEGVRGLRIGVVGEDTLAVCSNDARRAFAEAVEGLRREGAVLVPVRIPDMMRSWGPSDVIITAEALDYHRAALARNPEGYGPAVRTRLRRGFYMSALDYVRAQRVRARLIADMDASMEGVAAVVMPGHPVGSHPIGAKFMEVDGKEVELAPISGLYTRMFNLTGQPAMSVPAGFNAAGLPMSMQIVARPFDEVTMFRIGRAHERAGGWHERRPPLPS
jgi:Asp-tRNA(Asn)/Glu-tRNA(Gln) amidotransferase A subunit family amidase